MRFIISLIRRTQARGFYPMGSSSTPWVFPVWHTLNKLGWKAFSFALVLLFRGIFLCGACLLETVLFFHAPHIFLPPPAFVARWQGVVAFFNTSLEIWPVEFLRIFSAFLLRSTFLPSTLGYLEMLLLQKKSKCQIYMDPPLFNRQLLQI